MRVCVYVRVYGMVSSFAFLSLHFLFYPRASINVRVLAADQFIWTAFKKCIAMTGAQT